jgi:phosphatidylserine synthase
LVMVVLSLLMISNVQYNNFKQLKLLRPRSLQTMGIVVVGLLLIFTYPQNVIFIVFSLYVLSGLTSLAARYYSVQRAKRLGKLRRRSTDRPGYTNGMRPEEARDLTEKRL